MGTENKDLGTSASKARKRIQSDPDRIGRQTKSAGTMPKKSTGGAKKPSEETAKKPASGAVRKTSNGTGKRSAVQERTQVRDYGNEEDRGPIRINKKMRVWNKYKNFVIGGAIILVIVLIVVISVNSCAKAHREDQEQLYGTIQTGALQVTTAAAVPGQDTTQAAGQDAAQSAGQDTTQTTAATQADNSGLVLTTTKKAAREDFTSEDSYANAVFIGDAIAEGISYYGHLDSNHVVADSNMTTTKAINRVSEVAAQKPDKVYIMMGLNDLNYNNKTVDSIAESYEELVAELKSELPSARIYVIAVTPITKSCEDKTSINITMTNVEALNQKLKTMAGTSGAFFVDMNPALQDASGYLNSDVTSNGLNLVNGYYGFLLNAIAELTK